MASASPEAEYAGAIIDSASTGINLDFYGNGGQIFESAASTFNTATLQIVGGAVYIAANDLANGSNGALGTGTNALQIGVGGSVTNSEGGATTVSTANLGFMTNGTNAGVGASPTITAGRNIAVGGATGLSYNSACLGRRHRDYTQFTGTITLTEPAATATTTFFARNGGHVDFTNTISGAGSVTIGGNSVFVEGGSTGAAGIQLLNNGSIVFKGTDTYTGATTISTGKLYVDGSTVARARSLASGATLGGTGSVGGLVTAASGGIFDLEGGPAAAAAP